MCAPRSFRARCCRCRCWRPRRWCYPLGFSLDNLSLMALAIAAGFVVDDAIVMLEVIWRRIEHGQSAAAGGARRRARDQLHHPLDLDLADRGVHAADVHGWRGRAADARVRAHAQRRGGGVAAAVADADADAVRPVPAGARSRATGRLMRALERGFQAIETWLCARAGLGHGAQAPDARGVHLHRGRHRRGLPPRSRPASSRSRTPRFSTACCRPRTTPPTPRRPRRSSRSVASSPRTRMSPRCISISAAARQSGQPQRRPDHPRRRPHGTADQVIARLRPQLGAGGRCNHGAEGHAGHQHRRAQLPRRSTSTPCPIRTCSELNDWAPKMLAAMRKLPDLQDVSTDQQSDGAAVKLQIDRDAAGRFGITPSRHRCGDLRPDRPARGGAVLHAAQRLPRDRRGAAVAAGEPGAVQLRSISSRRSPAKHVPLSLFVKVDPNAHGPLVVAHQGQLPAVDAVVQSQRRAWRSARPRPRSTRCGTTSARPRP